MKTSNKLLLTAILIIIVSMVAYDLALRAEYRKGTYKSRFYGMEKVGFKGFKNIDNRVANLIDIHIEHGDNFGVWVNNDMKDRIKITQNGAELVIDTAIRNSTGSNNFYGKIVITCPSLDKVTTSSVFFKKAGERYYDNEATTALKGFDEQNLTLIINKSTHLNLDKSKIKRLDAIVGDSLSQHAYLFIGSSNQIEDAIISVPGKNVLNIENPKIVKSTFNISDSANISLGGSILKQLRH